jgi:hypothetical protein
MIAGLTALSLPASAAEGPTKGTFTFTIVADKTHDGRVKVGGETVEIKNHHEITVSGNLIFTHTDANDSIAEGRKDAAADMVAKSKPTISAGAKAANANVGGVNMMKLAEKCGEIEDEDEMEACMMKGLASFQAGLPEKCKTDPSLCQAITTIQDPKTMSGVTAAGEKYQADMKKFRFYKVENCVVDASVNYYRRERHTSEVGGFTFNDISSKTDGVARAVSSGTPCTLEMVVGPDNAISMNFSLASNLSVPGKTVETTGKVKVSNSVVLDSGMATKFPYTVRKQKSASPTSFSGQQGNSSAPSTSEQGNWINKGSSSSKLSWSISLN